jgi:hypothetical protein
MNEYFFDLEYHATAAPIPYIRTLVFKVARR